MGRPKSSSLSGIGADYSSDSSASYESSSQASPPFRRSNNPGNFGQSLRLATFRGGGSDDDDNDDSSDCSSDTEKMAEEGAAAARRHWNNRYSQQVDITLSADPSSPTSLKEEKVKAARRRSSRNYTSSTATAAAVTSELDSVVESLQSRLNCVPSSAAMSSYSSYDLYENDNFGDGELPYTIHQVTQNLESSLYTFNKMWVDGRSPKEQRGEEGGSPEKGGEGGVSKTILKEDQDMADELKGTTHPKDLAPYSSGIADSASMTPRSRAKALMKMLEGGSPPAEPKRGESQSKSGERDVATPDSSYFRDDDSSGSHDPVEDALAESLNAKRLRKTGSEAGRTSGGAMPHHSLVKHGVYDDDIDIANEGDEFEPDFLSANGGGWGQSKTRGNSEPSAVRSLYGKSTLLATSDDIVTELEVTMKCMQKRLNLNPADIARLKDEEDEEEGKPAPSPNSSQTSEIMKALNEAEDDSDFDEWLIDDEGKKTIVMRRRKKKGKGRGGKGDIDESNLASKEQDGNDERGVLDDPLFEQEDEEMFGATPFGWVPTRNAGTTGFYPTMEPADPMRTHQDPYFTVSKPNGDGDGKKKDDNDGQEQGVKAGADQLPAGARATTTNPADYPGIPAIPAISSAPPLSPRVNYNGEPRSPRLISTDEVYYNRYRPSAHENTNVATPVWFVSSKDSHPAAPQLNAPNTSINKWSYVPRRSTEWELTTHPSDQDKENAALGSNSFGSFPSTELKNLKAASSVSQVASSSTALLKRTAYSGSSILSARKRLEAFKSLRAQTEDSFAPAFNSSKFAVNNEEDLDSDSDEGGKAGHIAAAKSRLEEFKRMRQEKASFLTGKI